MLRYKLALEAGTGLATILAIMPSAAAVAADDPFQLPPSAFDNTDQNASETAAKNANYILFAEITINDEKKSRLVKLQNNDGEMYISGASAVYAGLVKTADPNNFIALSSIAGLEYTFDTLAYRLDITKLRESDGPNAIDFAARKAQHSTTSAPLTALIVDYDFNARTSQFGSSAAGFIATRLVRGNTALESNWRIQTDNAFGETALVRLDSALIINRPSDASKMTFGDFVAVTSANNRAVRMGGFQWATDFSTRPDLITYPLPDFSGDVAVPTSLDLLVNDRRYSSENVEPGEFTIRNIPVPLGRGEIGVVVRDALGRERLRSISFYSSRSLLARGLSQTAFNIGPIRRNFGRSSGEYGGFAGSLFHRRGINNRLTMEGAAEMSDGFVNLGGGGSVALGSIGLFSTDLRFSRHNIRDGQTGMRPVRRGNMIGAAFESAGQMLSFRLEARRVSDGYDDLASAKGDAPPKSYITANLNLNLDDLGSFGLAAVAQRSQRGVVPVGVRRNASVVSASYRKLIAKRINLFADLSRRSNSAIGGKSDLSALLGLSVQLGQRTNVQASHSRQNKRYLSQVGVYRPDSAPGEFGYSALASTGIIDRAEASLSYRSTWNRAEVQVQNQEGKFAAQISSRGSFIFADNQLFATEKVGGGFVIVDASNVAGVSVQRENRPAGKTSKSGKLLITEIPPFIAVKIGVDPKTLPHDAIARKLSDMIAVGPRAGTKLDLGVSHYKPMLIQLRDTRGTAFAPGTIIRALPSNSEYIAGYDGIVELNSMSGDTELQIILLGGDICHADLEMLNAMTDPDMPVLSCYSRVRTLPLAAMLKNGQQALD